MQRRVWWPFSPWMFVFLEPLSFAPSHVSVSLFIALRFHFLDMVSSSLQHVCILMYGACHRWFVFFYCDALRHRWCSARVCHARCRRPSGSRIRWAVSTHAASRRRRPCRFAGTATRPSVRRSSLALLRAGGGYARVLREPVVARGAAWVDGYVGRAWSPTMERRGGSSPRGEGAEQKCVARARGQ